MQPSRQSLRFESLEDRLLLVGISSSFHSTNPVTLYPGESAVVECRLQNHSPDTEAVRQTIYEDPMGFASLPGGVDYVDYVLPPGTFGMPATLVIAVPIDTPAGEYTVWENWKDIPVDDENAGGGMIHFIMSKTVSTPILVLAMPEPDLVVTAHDIAFSDDNPVEEEVIDVTVTVHNAGLSDVTENVVVQLFEGAPSEDGTQLASQTISGGLSSQNSTTVVFNDLPVGLAGNHSIYAQIAQLPDEEPYNNVAMKSLVVRDSDTEGPAITNITASEHDGDGDGIIEAGEQIRMTWSLADPSGIASAEIIVDGSSPIPIANLGSSTPLIANCEVVIGPLTVGRHEYSIRAIDADEDFGFVSSEESSEHTGSFEVSAESTVRLEATPVNDNIVVSPGIPGGAWHWVEINGITTTYDPALVNEIHIDGLSGIDRITIRGTEQNETAILQPGSVNLAGQTYELYGINIEKIDVTAGSGDDQVSMIGSDGSNRLYSYASCTLLLDSPRTFCHRAIGFDTVMVDATTGGRNRAFLHGSSADDLFDAMPDHAILERSVGTSEATTVIAAGFQSLYTYGMNGGTDEATLTGAGNVRNRLYSYANVSILTESRRSFYLYTKGFDTVTASSPSNHHTYAYLYDSRGADMLIAEPEFAYMDRAEPWSDTTAIGFTRVLAYSVLGGRDIAELIGSEEGGNYFRGRPEYASLTDRSRSFYQYARGFSSVTAIGSQTNPSSDRAYLYDSRGDDTFTGAGDTAIMEDTAKSRYRNEALYFDFVYALSLDRSTRDTVAVEDEDLLAYRLIRLGIW